MGIRSWGADVDEGGEGYEGEGGRVVGDENWGKWEVKVQGDESWGREVVGRR